MKRITTILLVTVALIAAAAGAGWLYFRANPAAWDEFQAEIAGEPAPSAARPADRPARKTQGLMASGTIEAEEIIVSTELGGRITALGSGEGELVAADEMLLQLDRAMLSAERAGALAAVEQARAAVEAAEAQLALAVAGARDEEIAAAEGAVATAQGGVAVAEAALAQAETAARTARANALRQAGSAIAIAEANLAQAEGAADAAEAAIEQAKAGLAGLLAGARPEEIAIRRAQLAQAEAELWYPTHVHDELIRNGVGGVPEEQARFQLLAVQAVRDAAKAQLDLAQAGATAAELAAARAAVSAAEGQLAVAQAGADASRAALAQAQTGLDAAQSEVELAEAGVAGARAQVDVAEGQRVQAVAQRDRLVAGPTDQETASLEAQVTQVKAALAAAGTAVEAIDIQLAHTTVTAPVGGTVLQRLVHAGELATPGAPLLVLANLDEVMLTVYVPEADLGKVSLGQTVEVTVDAYDTVFGGRVSHIASQAEFTPKNVQTQEERVHMVFAVKMCLSNADHQLKPGMPADAVFQ